MGSNCCQERDDHEKDNIVTLVRDEDEDGWWLLDDHRNVVASVTACPWCGTSLDGVSRPIETALQGQIEDLEAKVAQLTAERDALRPTNPPPQGGHGDVWADMIAETPETDPLRTFMVRRRELGILRYGTPLRYLDGRNAALDLFEELLDAGAYAYKLRVHNEAYKLRVLNDAGFDQDAMPIPAKWRDAVDLFDAARKLIPLLPGDWD